MTLDRKRVVVGIGEVLWDELPSGRRIGGAPANVAFHAQQLGARGIVASAVGDDPDGHALREQLVGNGLRTDYIQIDSLHPTGTVTVAVDAQGTPSYTIHVGAAWDNLQATQALTLLASTADAVCFGSLAQRSETTRKTIQSFLKATRADCIRVLDVNLRQHYHTAETVEQSLALCDVFKLNHEELPAIARMLRIRSQGHGDVAFEILRRFPLELVALTRAEKGSALYTKIRMSNRPGANDSAPPPVDTVGAGDSFTATLISGLLKLPNIDRISAEDLDSIHENASRVAAYVCSQPGATPTLPDELLDSLRST